MLKIKLSCVLLGGLILLLESYNNSFSQEVQKSNVSFSPKVTSSFDTCLYKPGDVWRDNKVNLLDIIELVGCAFRDCFANPGCVLDVNADGRFNVSDVVHLVNFIFKGGPTPAKSGECCL